MSVDTAFVDTNVLVYAFTQNPRTATAEALLRGGCAISVQSLNEFVSVAIRKLRMPWSDVLNALGVIRTLCPSPRPVTVETHELALPIAKRYGYRIYDALVIAAALRASCSILYSEDMHHGQTINGLRIQNPFRAIGVH
jgi:predicted nucleic acid-binding protein